MSEIIKKIVPLPATTEDLVSRKTMKPTSLNDFVDQYHVELWSEDDYKQLLDATSDEDAVEGSCAIDNAKAAEMIRTRAARDGNKYVAGKKLATIVKSLNVVLRRYHMTRKERAVMVGGVEYPAE